MAYNDCKVGARRTTSLPFKSNAMECAKNLEKQSGKPHGIRSDMYGSTFETYEEVIALPECKVGYVYGDDKRAAQCASSLQRLTHRSYDVSTQNLGWFSSTYLIVELCTPKTK